MTQQDTALRNSGEKEAAGFVVCWNRGSHFASMTEGRPRQAAQWTADVRSGGLARVLISVFTRGVTVEGNDSYSFITKEFPRTLWDTGHESSVSGNMSSALL